MTPDEAIRRYQAAYGRLRADLARRVTAMWTAAGGVSDEEADRFIQAAVAQVEGTRVAVASLVAGYVSLLSLLELGERIPLRLDASQLPGRQGVDLTEVYRRPVVTARGALSEGRAFDDAMELAAQRAGILAEADAILAQRDAMVAVARSDTRIVGYRRVLTGSSCALCAAASAQRYRSEDLMPIHGRCDCGVTPIFGEADPGRTINQGLVADLKTAAKTTGDRSYWESRRLSVDEDGNVTLPSIAVHEHGELGPVLTQAGHEFTGPSDI